MTRRNISKEFLKSWLSGMVVCTDLSVASW